VDEERVMCFPAQTLTELGEPEGGFSKDFHKYFNVILQQENISFINRKEAECNESFKQIIPYQVLKSDKSYFVYRRGHKGGEDRLHKFLSLGIGGHINRDDSIGNLSTKEIYNKGALRELDEEIELPEYYVQRSVGVIYDNSTAVGRVHLGFIELLDLKSIDVKVKDEALDFVGWWTLEQLQANYEQLEKWSQIVVDNFLT
jgi:predicted NUDIX family phosphoesterase